MTPSTQTLGATAVGGKLFKDSQLLNEYGTFDLIAYVPELGVRQSTRIMQRTSLLSDKSITFDVPALDLPSPSRLWRIDWPGHPEFTIQNLLAGEWPRPTEQDIAERSLAVRLAQHIRSKLDIRPLTTSTIIRALREGIEE